ncbi:MAG: hypothetical protein IPL72_14845 [Sulfuritalea sp.]|nr:hypothetical protein [Sulfuritalea sp.]
MHGVRDDVGLRAWTVRNRILGWIGIPCGVGIGPTKTLAKSPITLPSRLSVSPAAIRPSSPRYAIWRSCQWPPSRP